jgi:hypothetical protein
MRTIKQEVNVVINGFGGGDAILVVDYLLAPIEEDDDISIKMRVHSSYIDCKVYQYDEETDQENEHDLKIILKGMQSIDHLRWSKVQYINEIYIHSYEIEDGILTVKHGKYELGE